MSKGIKPNGLVIAVSGQVGSGKTTHAKKIAEHFNLRYVSNGALFRQLAKEKGVSLLELHKMAEENSEIDRLIDNRAIEEAKKGNVVVEGHLACWLLRDIADICIFFKAPLRERVKRIAERDNLSEEEAIRVLKERESSNAKRAKKYYNIDLNDWSIMDLIIDTSKLSVRAVDDVIITFIQLYIREVLKKKKSEEVGLNEC